MLLLSIIALPVFGQTMKWVPLAPGASLDHCTCLTASRKSNVQCFALQYIPAVSGTLTSYTTGFLVSCTSLGSPVTTNQSCSMTNNTNEINGCTELGQVLINSSGNTGTSGSNKIEAGKPVYLHQVCFNIPEGESVTIQEEELTDLTTSIDLGNSQFATESPAFITQTVGKPRYDVARPTVWLDFKSTSAGELVSQLDWSVKREKQPTRFVIEHAVDGIHYTAVAEVKAKDDKDIMSGYQYMHQGAAEGLNFYRLQCFTSDGQWEYSPIRTVSFDTKQFTVQTWPSPVSEILNVHVSRAAVAGRFELVDLAGKRALQRDFPEGTSSHEINVAGLLPGIYTLIVSARKDKQNEKVVILR